MELIDTSEDIAVELYTVISCLTHSHNIKIANISLKDVVVLKYLIRIMFMMKLRADQILGMLTAIKFGIFCLLTHYLTT
jgi:hypothetical protein